MNMIPMTKIVIDIDIKIIHKLTFGLSIHIYHTVNRLRSFLSSSNLGHSGHSGHSVAVLPRIIVLKRVE